MTLLPVKRAVVEGEWVDVDRLSPEELSLLLSAHEAWRDRKQKWMRREYSIYPMSPRTIFPVFVAEAIGVERISDALASFFSGRYYSNMSADLLLYELERWGFA